MTSTKEILARPIATCNEGVNERPSTPKSEQLVEEQFEKCTYEIIQIGKPQTGKTNTAKKTPSYPKKDKQMHDDKFKRLEVESFPDVDESNGRLKVLQTIPNIEHLLNCYGITAQYNVITTRVEILIPGLKSSPTNIANSTLTHIISLAKLNGIGTDQLPAYIATIADSHPKNPVLDWILGEKWDGVDRLPALYDTLVIQPEFPIDMRATLVKRWLISGVAAASFPNGFRTRGVLTLQGPQSIGKTSWLPSLIPVQMLKDTVIKIDHLLDVCNKDSVLQACSHWLVELGELESSFKRDQAKLKGFITSTGDKIRAPYARAPSEIPRHTVFFATVNESQFLVDQTGNTRFWTIPVLDVNFNHSIDMQQLWAQVAVYYLQGEQWWLTQDEEKRLEELNKPHRAISVIREKIESELDFKAPKDKWRKMTASQLLKSFDFNRPSNPQAKECGQILRELLGLPKKSQGAMRWLVPPIYFEPQTQHEIAKIIPIKDPLKKSQETYDPPTDGDRGADEPDF